MLLESIERVRLSRGAFSERVQHHSEYEARHTEPLLERVPLGRRDDAGHLQYNEREFQLGAIPSECAVRWGRGAVSELRP